MSISASPSAIICLVPQAAILIVEQHDRAVGVEPRRGARMLQQHQRRQPHDLGLGLEQPQQQARQPDRLVAQRRADSALSPLAE